MPLDDNARALIRRIVDRAPPLTEHQRAKISALLRGSSSTAKAPPDSTRTAA